MCESVNCEKNGELCWTVPFTMHLRYPKISFRLDPFSKKLKQFKVEFYKYKIAVFIKKKVFFHYDVYCALKTKPAATIFFQIKVYFMSFDLRYKLRKQNL